MRAVLCKSWGPPSALTVEETPSPAVGPKDVKISVYAAGLNFPDVLIVQGKYQFKPAFPFSPGGEVSGVVMAVGGEVESVAPGDRVMALTGSGGFAEECVAQEHSVFKIPDSMGYRPAAGFAMTYGTTYHALVDRGRLKAGEWLLVTGAGGGVGLNAVELGKLMGARVIAAAGSSEKLEAARRFGADHLINYREEKLSDRVKAITGQAGADVIYDPVGGDVFDECMRCIGWDGRLLVIGFASGRIPDLPVNRVLLKGCAVVGVFWGSFVQRDPAHNRRNFAALFEHFAAGRLNPLLTATYPLDHAPHAITDMMERRITGKALVLVRPDA